MKTLAKTNSNTISIIGFGIFIKGFIGYLDKQLVILAHSLNETLTSMEDSDETSSV